MSYGSRDDVKDKIGKPNEATYDDYIDDLLTQVSAYIDEKLRPYVTVPLSSPPTIIGTIASTMAAGWFNEEKRDLTPLASTNEPEQGFKRDVLTLRAERMLKEYIAGNYGTTQRSSRDDRIKRAGYQSDTSWPKDLP